MKKFLFILLITISVGIFAKPSFAGTCEGGVEFDGAVNNHTYCRSSTGMTWWAAIAWCKKQGRELASMDQLCNWGGITGADACLNMKVGTGLWGWSANPSGSSYAFTVNLSSGNFSHSNLRTGNDYALCFQGVPLLKNLLKTDRFLTLVSPNGANFFYIMDSRPRAGIHKDVTPYIFLRYLNPIYFDGTGQTVLDEFISKHTPNNRSWALALAAVHCSSAYFKWQYCLAGQVLISCNEPDKSIADEH